MASRRKSTTPCMIRANDITEQDDSDEMEVGGNGSAENGRSPPRPGLPSEQDPASARREAAEQEKPDGDARPPRKLQGGYECKYCPFSTQNLNQFKEHVDANHPNVILNPLYLCAACDFNTKKFDTLTEHNEKHHPGESNFRFKRIKLNSQTILEQTIETAANSAVIYNTATNRGADDFPAPPLCRPTAAKLGKTQTDSKRLSRKGDDLENRVDGVSSELPKKQMTAVNVNGTVIIPEASLKEGLSHIMPSLQRPPNFNLVPKIAVPLNTTKYNPSLDGNMTLITSFNKFPYPTQAELSWLTAASKHPEEQIKVWFTTQRLKQGISWSPEEVEEARKKMFNGTIQPVQQTFTVLPAQLTQPNKATQSLIQTVPCQVFGQSSLVLTPVANGSTVTCSPIALTVANQVVQALKRPLPAPAVAPAVVKRPSIIQSVLTPPKSSSPTSGCFSDQKKTRDQISVLKASYLQSQFPEDKEVYRLIEATGLSRGEIKKWFSDQRYRNHKGALHLKSDLLPKDAPQKPVQTQFPLLERMKGKTSEQLKTLEESFQKTSFPTQADVNRLVADTQLSKKEINSWFTERRALRDDLEQALLNSMGSKKVDGEQQQRGTVNGIHDPEGQTRSSPLPAAAATAPGPQPIEGQSLGLLRDVFAQTQWPSPEEYSQLEVQTGLARTEIVRWFKDNRSALRSGTLDWLEKFQEKIRHGPGNRGSPPSTAHAPNVLQQVVQEAKAPREEDAKRLTEQSKLGSQEIMDWFTSKLGQKTCDLGKGGGQRGQAGEDQENWVARRVDDDNIDFTQKELVSEADGATGDNSGRVTG